MVDERATTTMDGHGLATTIDFSENLKVATAIDLSENQLSSVKPLPWMNVVLTLPMELTT